MEDHRKWVLDAYILKYKPWIRTGCCSLHKYLPENGKIYYINSKKHLHQFLISI